MATPAYRVAVDIGGTFTDLVALGEDGGVLAKKVPSTPDDFARGIVEGLQALLRAHDLAADQVGEVVHGTTVAANAILEDTGARTGLITTRGFRDILEIRRLRVPRLYDPTWQKPPALVERRLRVEVDERVNFRGEVTRSLDRRSLEQAVAHLVQEGVEAIAICLLHSYANPVHEQAVKAFVRERVPDIALSVSAEVLPEIMEYERTSTVVINAYVMPVVRRYLHRLTDGLRAAGVQAPLRIMQSNGGVMSPAMAAAMPMHIIESGPAAGVVGARALAQRLDLPDLITLDIGGTTAKAAMIEGGEVSRAAEYEVGGGIIAGARLLKGAGYLLRAPAIDLAEVGAGGGSLLRLDRGGALRVGPQSAGAVPGPVCYGLGGSNPTITDANVVLGYINPAALAGGAVRLQADLARRAILDGVARPLDLPLEEAAHGAHVIAATAMIRAIRAVSSERGRDPRDYGLCAFGGNGPVFAATMARALEMRRVIIPPMPGLFSAFGLLLSPREHHLARSILRSLDVVTPAELDRLYADLEARSLAPLRAEGIPPERVVLERAADLHYAGQSFELTVPVPRRPLAAAELAEIAEAFAREHARTYGHRAGEDELVELVSLRLVARVRAERSPLPARLHLSAPEAAAGPAMRSAYFGREHGWITTPVLSRARVGPVARPGPLLIDEYDATTVVPPDATVQCDAWGTLHLTLG